MKVSLLTGGRDPHYALGLLSGLLSAGIEVEFIGNDEMQDAAIIRSRSVVYHNLRGDQRADAPTTEKMIRVLRYYFRLLKYSVMTDSRLFHILWLNKFVYFDSIVLTLFYRMLGKKVLFTAHNVNIRERDEKDTWLNRWTLKFMYKNMDHIFVHTEKMKMQLSETVNISDHRVTVIPFGINNAMPRTALIGAHAKKMLHLAANEKVILFFGNIAPYKGLEYLVSAMVHLTKGSSGDYKFIIAGRVKNCKAYWGNMKRVMEEHGLEKYIIAKIDYIPDDEVEVYFKCADVAVLPYKHIFQSGVLFLSYSFGLPVIAADVGSLREEIVEGETGFLCRPQDPEDLAAKIDRYFKSDLYKNLETHRQKIMKYANERHSWETIGEKTVGVYKSLWSIRV